MTTGVAPAAPAASGAGRERVAVILLLIATALAAGVYTMLVAPLVWVPGIALLALSRRWSTGEKLWGYLSYGVGGLLVPIILIFGPFLRWFSGLRHCPGDPGIVQCGSDTLSVGVVVSFVVIGLIFAWQLFTAWQLWRSAERG